MLLPVRFICFGVPREAPRAALQRIVAAPTGFPPPELLGTPTSSADMASARCCRPNADILIDAKATLAVRWMMTPCAGVR